MTCSRPSASARQSWALSSARLQRRIHLHERAETGVVVDTEQQVMRAGFAGNETTVIGQQFGFRAGGNVQHVKPVPMAMCQIDCPPRGDKGGLVVADSGVIGNVPSPAPPRDGEGSWILAMLARTVVSSSQCAAIGSVVSAKMRSRASCSSTSKSPVLEPMKILMPGVRWACCSSSRLSAVGADVKAVIDERLLGRQREFLVQAGLRGGGRRVLGISRNVVTPPFAQARLAVVKSSLCVRPGSRKWTWSSMTPGKRYSPAASTTSSTCSCGAGSISAMRARQ